MYFQDIILIPPGAIYRDTLLLMIFPNFFPPHRPTLDMIHILQEYIIPSRPYILLGVVDHTHIHTPIIPKCTFNAHFGLGHNLGRGDDLP